MNSPLQNRKAALSALANESFDLVIVGGGITGCSIARDAALRGLKVALVEKRDFASGTSSKSTKLIHGGIRYLEQAEFKLVFESVNERKRLMRLARHLVRPLPFMMPNYKGDRRWLLTLDIGLWMYEALCFFDTYKNHKTYGPKRAVELEPGLKPTNLRGSIVYYDAMADDARVTLENAIDAAALGATVLNHVRAGALVKSGDTITGVSVTDEETKASFDVRAKLVINAGGPWSDEVRALLGESPVLKPTKGIHVVVDSARLPLNHAMVLLHPKDARVAFTIPWGWGRTVIGTTDTFFDGTPDKVEPTASDVDYLLEMANAYFPDAKLVPTDVLSTWSGLRPLLKPPDAAAGASQVSREHMLYERQGFITIAGGKLTTYRKMAREVVDRACAQLKVEKACATETRPLPGSVGLEESDAALEALRQSLEADAGQAQARLFTEAYGVRAKSVLSKKASPGGAEPLDPELPYVMAQVDEAMQTEFATTLDDVLARRLSLILRARDQGLGIAEKVAARMATTLAWSPERTAQELALYRAEVAASRRFR